MDMFDDSTAAFNTAAAWNTSNRDIPVAPPARPRPAQHVTELVGFLHYDQDSAVPIHLAAPDGRQTWFTDLFPSPALQRTTMTRGPLGRFRIIVTYEPVLPEWTEPL